MLTNVFLFFQDGFRFLFPHLFRPDLFGFFYSTYFFWSKAFKVLVAISAFFRINTILRVSRVSVD
jgi:hypothetical protein